MEKPGTAVAIFLTKLEPGSAGGGLAGALGPERASLLYRECVLLVLAKALRLKSSAVFVFPAPEEKSEVETFVLSRFDRFEGRFVAQSGARPGDRLHHALDHLCGLGFARQVILRANSPTLPDEFIQRGVSGLADHDCTIGPTWGGGFYLLGVKRPDARMFAEVSWGSGLELGQVYDNVSSLRMKCLLLPRWQEADTDEDLAFLKGSVRHADYRRLKEILA